jgi:hypothetical protein
MRSCFGANIDVVCFRNVLILKCKLFLSLYLYAINPQDFLMALSKLEYNNSTQLFFIIHIDLQPNL